MVYTNYSIVDIQVRDIQVRGGSAHNQMTNAGVSSAHLTRTGQLVTLGGRGTHPTSRACRCTRAMSAHTCVTW